MKNKSFKINVKNGFYIGDLCYALNEKPMMKFGVATTTMKTANILILKQKQNSPWLEQLTAMASMGAAKEV